VKGHKRHAQKHALCGWVSYIHPAPRERRGTVTVIDDGSPKNFPKGGGGP